MRDLFREGLRLGESMARLPWEAARRVGRGSETVRHAANLGERLGTLPFRAASALLGGEIGGENGRGSGPGSGAEAGRDPGTKTGATARPRRVVVLGAGYAGLSAFLELQEHLPRGYEVVLVNSDKYHWFTTELHTYVAGEEPDAVRVPLSRVVARPGRLVVDRVSRVNVTAKRVELTSGAVVDYDYLVFALGSAPEYFGLPGVAEHSLVVGNWQGATHLRNRISTLFSHHGPDTPLHVVVAGGGLTGVEVAGELADEYGGRVRLTLVEAGPDIMAGFAPELVRTAREVLESKGITIKTGNPIARVDEKSISYKDGDTMAFDVLVWAGGVRGSSVLAESGLELTPRGRARVDSCLRAVGRDEVYVVGDSASFLDPGTGHELPPTAQAAVQMGRAAGLNLIHRIKGRPEVPFVPNIRGAFASLGRKHGVGQMGEEQFTGVPAMLIKNLIESHHAWETGGGVLPLLTRLLRGPQRYLRGAARPRPAYRPTIRHTSPAARPEVRHQ